MTNLRLRCAQSPCDEEAISFSKYCWGHTDQAGYPAVLQASVDQVAPGLVFYLNLKKVEIDALNLSHLKLKSSSFSQAKLSRCAFIGSDLSESNLIGANLTRCDFVGADLSSANLTRATLTHSTLSFADLRGACLVESVSRDTDFTGTLLWKVNLWNADISGAAHIKRKNFQDPSKPSDLERARLLETDALVSLESYRSVKHYFNQKGLHEDAGWAAYRELTMERKHFYKMKDSHYLPSLLMDILSGYTEKPNRVIISSIVMVLLFGLIYYLGAAVRPTLDTHVPMGLWENIYFSFMTFTTVGFGDFVPQSFAWVRMLVCVEAFSGPFMAGLYIFTLTRRYSAH